MADRTDIFIIGGGPAGLAAANRAFVREPHTFARMLAAHVGPSSAAELAAAGVLPG